MFCGKVIHGDGLARVLGYPTANVHVSSSVVNLVDGVYAALASVGANTFQSVLIVSQSGKKTEVHILDKALELYGQDITVEPLAYISSLVPCKSTEDLQKVMHLGVEKVRLFFLSTI